MNKTEESRLETLRSHFEKQKTMFEKQYKQLERRFRVRSTRVLCLLFTGLFFMDDGSCAGSDFGLVTPFPRSLVSLDGVFGKTRVERTLKRRSNCLYCFSNIVFCFSKCDLNVSNRLNMRKK
jgi:hypothetical protein